MTESADIRELHDRQYSIYDSLKEQKLALRELNERNYRIFGELETNSLREEYSEEFSKIAHKMSLVSVHEQAKTSCLFVPKVSINISPKHNANQVSSTYNSHKIGLGKILACLLTIASKT